VAPACDPRLPLPPGTPTPPAVPTPPVQAPSLPGLGRSAAAPPSQQQQTQLLDYLLKP
jgi:hypothetical protein